jgi:hypothetical protein
MGASSDVGPGNNTIGVMLADTLPRFLLFADRQDGMLEFTLVMTAQHRRRADRHLEYRSPAQAEHRSRAALTWYRRAV